MTLKYKDIEYTLRRSDRKTASIYVERDGGVSVLVPETLSHSEIDDLLEKKRKWIYQKLAEWRDLNAARIQREYVNGEGFLYLGRSYRLMLVDEQSQPLMLRDGYFQLLADADPEEAFIEFYREKAKQRIAQRVEYYQDRMGVDPTGVRIIDLRNRWASCSKDGRVNFHWKCMMAPPKVLDYIVVHELAHIIHPHHTDAFWHEVDKILPDYRERVAWLRENGAGMDL